MSKLVKGWRLFFLYWSIVDLQCCVNFCYTAKWFSYTYTYILFNILFHWRLILLPSFTSLSSLLLYCPLQVIYYFVSLNSLFQNALWFFSQDPISHCTLLFIIFGLWPLQSSLYDKQNISLICLQNAHHTFLP